jgi:Cu-Zn family superoxide dismutase
MRHALSIGIGVLAAGLGLGCSSPHTDQNNSGTTQHDTMDAGPTTRPAAMSVAAADQGKSAVAMIHGAGDNRDKISGKATFTQQGDGVKVVIDAEGLAPGKHGIHVHEKNDLSKPDLSSAGPHFNPADADHHHSGPDDPKRHAGDLGNIEADQNGKGHLELTTNELSIDGAKNGVIGHSVIIHKDPDDLKSQPAGNSGARIAGGAIEADAHHHQPNS